MVPDECVHEMSAVEYLRDFILISLIITPQEQEILNKICKTTVLDYDKCKKASKKELKKFGLKLCKKCGKIKTNKSFYSNRSVCKECIKKERRQRWKNEGR